MNFFAFQKGFTLVELILVIVLLSIIGLMGADFISQAFKGFADSENRMEIYEEGKIALVRMEREIRNAVPNAFNSASATDLQFGMIDETAMFNCFGQYTTNNPQKFIRDRTAPLPVNTILSIYNLSWTHFTAAATPRLYEVSAVTMPDEMDLENGLRDIEADSPQKRYYAVDKAVRYCLNGTTLRRDFIEISNANYESGISFDAACSGKPLATGINNLSLSYQPGTATNSPLVVITFTIARNNDSIQFHKEVLIANVP
jgi:MSHA biogenesis protein MshO